MAEGFKTLENIEDIIADGNVSSSNNILMQKVTCEHQKYLDYNRKYFSKNQGNIFVYFRNDFVNDRQAVTVYHPKVDIL